MGILRSCNNIIFLAEEISANVVSLTFMTFVFYHKWTHFMIIYFELIVVISHEPNIPQSNEMFFPDEEENCRKYLR